MTKRKHHSRTTREGVLDRFGKKCAMCRCEITPASGLEFDHRIPLALGGEDEAHNLEPLCKVCHRLKTKGDVGRIRQADRQRAVSLGTKPKGKAQIASRPKPPRIERDRLPYPARQPLYRDDVR